MDITNTQITILPIGHIVNNSGQIPGVPKNPRTITAEKFDALKKRMRNENLLGVFPLKVFLHEGKYIALGGNQRLRAAKALGMQDVPCIVLPEDTDADTLREVVILENTHDGLNDWDALANEWDDVQLADWGLDVPTVEKKGDKKEIPAEEEFAEILNEENNYIVLKFDNEVDWIQAEQLFYLQRKYCGSYRQDGGIKPENLRKGIARVIDGAEAINRLTSL